MEQNRSAALVSLFIIPLVSLLIILLVSLLNELILVSMLIILTARQFWTLNKLFPELRLIKFVLYSLRLLQAARQKQTTTISLLKRNPPHPVTFKLAIFPAFWLFN